MKPVDENPRMADEYMFRHDAPGAEFERDHLQRAKERQDKVHAALEVWIAAAIAELAAAALAALERRRILSDQPEVDDVAKAGLQVG